MNGPGPVPATYYRLVVDGTHGNGRFGKYVQPFQSRQSPLVWKLFNTAWTAPATTTWPA